MSHLFLTLALSYRQGLVYLSIDVKVWCWKAWVYRIITFWLCYCFLISLYESRSLFSPSGERVIGSKNSAGGGELGQNDGGHQETDEDQGQVVAEGYHLAWNLTTCCFYSKHHFLSIFMFVWLFVCFYCKRENIKSNSSFLEIMFVRRTVFLALSGLSTCSSVWEGLKWLGLERENKHALQHSFSAETVPELQPGEILVNRVEKIRLRVWEFIFIFGDTLTLYSVRKKCCHHEGHQNDSEPFLLAVVVMLLMARKLDNH